MKTCVLCGFVFEPRRWAGYDRAGNPVESMAEAEFIVTVCDEHHELCCPMCYACQSVAPTPDLIQKALERRRYHERVAEIHVDARRP